MAASPEQYAMLAAPRKWFKALEPRSKIIPRNPAIQRLPTARPASLSKIETILTMHNKVLLVEIIAMNIERTALMAREGKPER